MRPLAYETGIVLAVAFAPLVPSWAGAILVLVLAVAWGLTRPPTRELAWVAPMLAVAAVALALDTADRAPGLEQRTGTAAEQLELLWSRQDREAQAVVADLLDGGVLDVSATPARSRREAFRRLEKRTQTVPREPMTWLLFEPGGSAFAWAGSGLLHDLRRADELPEGRSFRSSFTAVSLLSTQAIPSPNGDWHLVVGRSLSKDSLPGESRGRGVWGWSLLEEGRGDTSPGWLEQELSGGRLVVRPDLPPNPPVSRYRTVAMVFLGLALLALGLVRTGERYARTLRILGPLVLGAVLLAAAAGAARGVIVLLGLSLIAVLLSPMQSGGKGRWGSSPVVETIAGLAIAAVLVAGAYLLQRWTHPVDLGSELIDSPARLALRLGFFLAALALLLWVPRGTGAHRVRQRWAWLALAAGGLGAAFHAWSFLGQIALVIATVSGIGWLRRGTPLDKWTGKALVCVIAAVLAALSWEIAYHQVLERDLGERVLAELAPPDLDELAEIEWAARQHFEGFDLGGWSPTSTTGDQARDLAFALWRESPLARGGALSAVFVDPVDGPSSTFSFGLPLTESGGLDDGPPVWDELALPGWEEALVGGESDLRAGSAMAGRVRYWSLLRPGFRWAPRSIDRVTEGLLQGGPGAELDGKTLPGGARFALFEPDGTVRLAPWKGLGDLDAERALPSVVDVSAEFAGRAHAFEKRDNGGIRVLYLPIPEPIAGLERVATHVMSPLLVVAATVAMLFVVNIGRQRWRRRLARSWRSYSTRLLILYSVILIAPLVVANVLLLRGIGDRLEREDREAGQAALESAQRILGEYVLTLEPGFGVDTALDDELLLWLSRVLHREVNLYWDSQVYASSKPELFAAGLLPTRVPGEVFSRLALDGGDLAIRTGRAGGAVYQEFYAPVRVPGAQGARSTLYLSTPLLAQEVERQEQLSAIRRRIVLSTSALGFLLVALGTRLARRFTEPLMKIVEGTERIAAGATSLEFVPAETELGTLAGAIDEMAGRIASGRQRLLHEKHVVDTVIDSITSGVVSLDREGRVLLLNRNARELLGVEVGASLVEQLAGRERFTALVDFLSELKGKTAQKTLRVASAGDGAGAGEPDEREWTVIWVPLRSPEEPAAILVLEDVTEVLRGQRLEAWAEMARMIAHEIKNPLTPIRLSAEHLREVYNSRREELDGVFERCTENILRQVDELQSISSEFSTYSRIPRAELREGDLGPAVARIVGAYRSPAPAGVRIDYQAPADAASVRFDEKLLGRAVRNLLENAVRAVAGGGDVEVVVERRDSRVEIRVSDTGPGVDPAQIGRIFEPYFSTDDSGTGLGLPIARRIVEEHGGSVYARNRPTGGLEVTVSLPRGDGAAIPSAPMRSGEETAP